MNINPSTLNKVTSLGRKALRHFFCIKPVRDHSVSWVAASLFSIAIVLTQLGDYASTKLGLQTGAVEVNGAMAQFIAKYGNDAFLFLKVAASAFLVWACWKRPIFTGAVLVIYTGVVFHNLLTLQRLAG